MTDAIEDIPEQFENQTQQNKPHTNSQQLNNVPTGNSTSDTQKESTQHNTRINHNQRKITVNNGQKYRLQTLLQSNMKKPNKKSDAHSQTIYGTIIRKLDRLTD